jgi:putative DNA primase/helicase
MNTLSPEHEAYLAEHAVTLETALAFGVRSITNPDQLPTELGFCAQAVPGILFPWRTPSGKQVPQFRPDVPLLPTNGDRPSKYLFPSGSGSVIGVIRESETGPVIWVEGTKQALAIASLIPDAAVYVLAGCRNWSTDGVPEADLEVVDGRDNILIFDADIESNHDVWASGQQFAEALTAEGAKSIKYVKIPAAGTAGLDDVLGKRARGRRAAYLNNLLGSAKGTIKEPRRKRRGSTSADQFFTYEGGLLVRTLAEAVFDAAPLLLTEERKVAAYANGVYRLDGMGFVSIVTTLLDERYRKSHRTNVEEFLAGRLHEQGLIAPTWMTVPYLNCPNGMLDLHGGGELMPASPDFRSMMQIPIPWIPGATCPTYEDWIESVIPGQVDDIEEVASTMLDPTRTPTKALFAFGPSRSGKSTFLRILGAIAGKPNTDSVTLHQLAEDRFAAAELYGKMLNTAADLSAREVSDLSMFKLMTGVDQIHANRKWGSQFSFTNKALFAFSANELPNVSEASRAYIERVKPFKFGQSFAGAEDQSIEDKIIGTELPGVLVRLVKAYRRLRERGSYLPTDAATSAEFEIGSDRVRQWLEDEMTVIPGIREGEYVESRQCSTRTELTRMFNVWAQRNYGASMNMKTVIGRLVSIAGVVECFDKANKGRVLNVVRREAGTGGNTVRDTRYFQTSSFTPRSNDEADSGGLSRARGGSRARIAYSTYDHTARLRSGNHRHRPLVPRSRVHPRCWHPLQRRRGANTYRHRPPGRSSSLFPNGHRP